MSEWGPARKAAANVGVMLLGLISLLAFSGGPEDEDLGTDFLGARAPQVQGTSLDGRDYDIDDYRGTWVLVNFFATWCPGCVNEHPELVELERIGAERGDLSLVSVVFNDPVDRVEEFFEQRGGSWPVLNNARVPVDYEVLQIPETFLVSPSGQIALHVTGEVFADDVMAFIEGSS